MTDETPKTEAPKASTPSTDSKRKGLEITSDLKSLGLEILAGDEGEITLFFPTWDDESLIKKIEECDSVQIGIVKDWMTNHQSEDIEGNGEYEGFHYKWILHR